jgi:hypothetical protein
LTNKPDRVALPKQSDGKLTQPSTELLPKQSDGKLTQPSTELHCMPKQSDGKLTQPSTANQLFYAAALLTNSRPTTQEEHRSITTADQQLIRSTCKQVQLVEQHGNHPHDLKYRIIQLTHDRSLGTLLAEEET